MEVKEQRTPGPWVLSTKAARYRAVPVNKEGKRILRSLKKLEFDALSIGADNGQVAIVPLDESNEANARLIAAAPELLEAAEEMVSLIHQADPLGVSRASGLYQWIREATEKLRAAIAKAKGE